MQMSLIQWILPISIAILEAIILLVLTQRKLRGDFPAFFSYLTFNICGFLLLVFTSRGSATGYFYSFWIVTSIGMFLGFAVLYEVFVNAMKPFSAVIDLAKMLFRWAALFLLTTAVLTAFATTGSTSSKICAAVLLMERSVQLMQCGLLLFLVVFEARFALSWRSQGMAVGLGLGISSAVGLSASYLQDRIPAWSGTVDLVDGTLRAAVLGFWLLMFLLPQPDKQSAENSPKRLILQRWNDALASGGAGGGAISGGMESFLPGIEKTVDRVLARKAIQ